MSRTAAWPVALATCSAVALLDAASLPGTEFGEGLVTGVLVRVCLAGAGLFGLGVLVSIAGIAPWRGVVPLSVVAAGLCAPLYLVQIWPAALDAMSSLPRSVPGSGLQPNGGAIAGLMSFLVLLVVSAIRRVSTPSRL